MNAASLPLVSARPSKLSYGDLLLLPEDGRRHELLDGEHFTTTTPSRRHQTVALTLMRHLEAPAAAAYGVLLAAPFDVVLSPHDVVTPDLLFVSLRRLDRLADANFQGAPDLVIEVLSPETSVRDEEVKPWIYARFGVIEYWLVDPEAEEVTVMRSPDHSEGSTGRLAAGDTLHTSLLPGLRLAVRGLFEAR